jgi:hypothetical protein
MGNASIPTSMSGIWSGNGAPAGTGAGAASGSPASKPPLATATPVPAATPQPGFVAAGMGANGVPDYVSNWLAQGGQGKNPFDPNVSATPTAAGADLLQGTAAPSVLPTAAAVTPGVRPGVKPAVKPGVKPGVAPGVTPATQMTPQGTVPPGSMYDPRYGAAPGVQGLDATSLAGITDDQFRSWLQRGGGVAPMGQGTILGPEEAWTNQGRRWDQGQLRNYAMWQLGLGNGVSAASQYQAPAPITQSYGGR